MPPGVKPSLNGADASGAYGLEDDSSGKGKIAGMQHRAKLLGAVFALGLFAGVMLAERLYIRVNREDIAKGAKEAAVQAHLRALGDDPMLVKLEELLLKVAPDKEVLVAVSNISPLQEGMLDVFIDGAINTGLTNYVVVALDVETEKALKAKGRNVFHMPIQIAESQEGTGDNHAISALKFGILKRFLLLGWSVLLSDLDICVLQNPFKHLYRDSDVEGMSDGFDDPTAYGSIEGFDDPSMGWARYAQFYKHFNLNSGLFYLRANNRTIELMQRLETRLAREQYWDQTAYNEEIFFLSHDEYKSPQVSVRVMNIDKFMNSKRLFKDVRNRAEDMQPDMPVTVHINYHPDKFQRMKAVFQYYLHEDRDALKPFPGGSEPGT